MDEGPEKDYRHQAEFQLTIQDLFHLVFGTTA
jgi:hypothetical protein